MAKNNQITRGKACAALAVAGMLLLGSCAEGYESPDGFDMGVLNTQMQTPVQDSISFKVSTDGTTATVSWPLVPGAGGHEVTFLNVDDPENPVVIDGFDKKIVDGSSFTVSVAEDSKYQMSMRTLGNSALGNTDAAEPSVFNFSTLVRSVATIPSGSDIYEFWQTLQLDTLGEEVAIELEPNGQYTLSNQVDFGPHYITFRGDKVHRPTVNITGNGSFATYGGLKVKFINFDMSEATARSFLYMSPKETLPDELLVQNNPLYTGSKLGKNFYMVEAPIYIAHCWFKNLPQAILHDNNVACAFWYFTLTDCIVQMRNTYNQNIGFITMWESDANNGGRSVKNIVLENSTIYNTTDNASACFIRYSNESNSQPAKTYGEFNADFRSHSWKFQNVTLANVYYNKANNSGWRFVNNTSGTDFFLTIDHTIFYNCTQLYRMTGLGSRTFRFNFFWNDRADDQNRNRTAQDSYKAPFASEYDPMFGGDNDANVYKELDLTQPNGGVDFTPQEYEITRYGGGDPRWLADGSGDES